MRIIVSILTLLFLVSCNVSTISKTEPSGQKQDQVVDAGYGKMNQKEVTTHINKIDGQNPKFASYTNIYDMIKSEVPGVRVNGTTIYIVEPSSINSSNEPLIVVDGSPVSSLTGIEPGMIKSIDVLKGAAASIYGTRGSNGVIVINLLRGPRKN